MILSDEGIRRAIADGKIELDPPPAKEHYSPSAVDILVGPANTFYRWKHDSLRLKGIKVVLDLAEQTFGQTARAYAELVPAEQDGSIILPPYFVAPQVMLCQTRQRIYLKPESKLAARVEGRSSMARYGLMVHLTAPTIHAGYNGTITLEMVNHGPFWLNFIPNATPICQFIFECLETPPEMAIATGFQGQKLPTGG